MKLRRNYGCIGLKSYAHYAAGRIADVGSAHLDYLREVMELRCALNNSTERTASSIDIRTYLSKHEPQTLDIMLDPSDPEAYRDWQQWAEDLAHEMNMPVVRTGPWIRVHPIVWTLVFR